VASLAVGALLLSPGWVGTQPADSPCPMFRGGPRHTGRSPYDTSHVDGTEKWHLDIGGPVYSSPAIGSDGTVYVGSDDGNLYAVNPDGTEKWHFTTGIPVRSSPAIGPDGTVYVSSTRSLPKVAFGFESNLYAIGASKMPWVWAGITIAVLAMASASASP